MKAIPLLLVLCMVTFSFSQSPDITVEVEGYGKDLDEAMVSAKRSAVEKGVGTIIQSETEIKNYMVNKDVILTKVMGAVKSVEKLSETKGADKMVTVKIRAVVSSAQIHDDLTALKVLFESVQKPRIMIMIQEVIDSQEDPSFTNAETEIIRFLTEKEIEIVDKASVENARTSETYAGAVKGNVESASAIGLAAGAEIAIVGSAISAAGTDMGGQLGGLKSCQADVSVRIIVCATGKVIASKNEHASAAHGNSQTAGTKAIITAAKKVMDDYLFDKLIASWQDAVNNGLPLSVNITNVNDFNLTKKIPEAIKKNANGVVSVTERGWNRTAKVMQLSVVYKGTGKGFCSSVHNKIISGNRFFLVTGTTVNSIEIRAAVK